MTWKGPYLTLQDGLELQSDSWEDLAAPEKGMLSMGGAGSPAVHGTSLHTRTRQRLRHGTEERPNLINVNFREK